jgi:hypothetical protein
MLTLLASAAVLVGYGATSGLGECPGFEAAAYLSSPHVAVEASGFTADKIESGRGWGVRGSAELRYRGLGAGLSYTYRDGGAWSKHYPWLRASAGYGPLRLVGEWTLGGVNQEKKLELRTTAHLGWVVVEPRVFVECHLQGVGYGVVLLTGWGTREKQGGRR